MGSRAIALFVFDFPYTVVVRVLHVIQNLKILLASKSRKVQRTSENGIPNRLIQYFGLRVYIARVNSRDRPT